EAGRIGLRGDDVRAAAAVDVDVGLVDADAVGVGDGAGDLSAGAEVEVDAAGHAAGGDVDRRARGDVAGDAGDAVVQLVGDGIEIVEGARLERRSVGRNLRVIEAARVAVRARDGVAVVVVEDHRHVL